MEHLNRADRACAVAAAAAHDLNNELTVILSSICGAIAELEANHPARPLLVEARSSAQRCAWKASGLLNFSARRGVASVRSSLAELITD